MTSRPSVPRPRPRPGRPERPGRPDDAAAAGKVQRRVPDLFRDGVDAWTLERARRTRAGVAANVMTRERRSDANESVESTRTGEVSTNYNARRAKAPSGGRKASVMKAQGW